MVFFTELGSHSSLQRESMKKETILVVLISEFADWEPALLSAGLRWGFGMWEKTYDIKTVSVDVGHVHSIGGLTVIPDHTVANAPADFAALILIGGTNWFGEEGVKTLPLIRAAIEKKAIVGAICDASIFLAAHGFLNNVQHTCTSLVEVREKTGKLYAGEKNFQEQQSVRDGNIITAKPTGYLEFARDVFLAMNVAPKDELEKFYSMCKYGK